MPAPISTATPVPRSAPLTGLAGILAAALLLTGCGPSSPTAPPAEPTTNPAPAPTPIPRITTPSLAAASPTASATASPSSIPSSFAPTEPTTDPATDRHSDPTSPLVLVNKHHPLDPIDFVPEDLVPVEVSSDGHLQIRAIAAPALTELFEAAATAGVPLKVVSGYRSYHHQISSHQTWTSVYGKERGELVSARPGYSEHQTGLAVDVVGTDGICTLRRCFADTPAGQWLTDHAHEYGWVVRYPDNAQEITGYSYEPWHLRYVGVEEAAKISAAGTIEAAWGFEPARHYLP